VRLGAKASAPAASRSANSKELVQDGIRGVRVHERGRHRRGRMDQWEGFQVYGAHSKGSAVRVCLLPHQV
jgi:hypothetical protein